MKIPVKQFSKALFCCLALAASKGYPQNKIEGIGSTDLNKLSTGASYKYYSFDDRYEGVKGSPYYQKAWVPATVDLLNGKEYKLEKTKYNLYSKALEYVGDQQAVYALSMAKIAKLVLKGPGEHHVFIKAKISQKGDSAFLEKKISGAISLYKSPQVMFEPANYLGAFATGNTYDEYSKSDQYFLQNGNGALVKLKMNKNFAKKYFTKNRQLVVDYIKQHDPDLRKEEGWGQLLDYYNTL